MPPIDPCGAPVDDLQHCYSAWMRFYQDDCERLLRVHWYWVDRLDYITPSVFVSSKMDDDPRYDGFPVGEQAGDQEERDGSIPPGTRIGPTPKGTPAQWQGAITLSQRVRPALVCQPSVFPCRTGYSSTLTLPPCAGLPYNGLTAPTLIVNGAAVALSSTFPEYLPGGYCPSFAQAGGSNQYLPPGNAAGWWGWCRLPSLDLPPYEQYLVVSIIPLFIQVSPFGPTDLVPTGCAAIYFQSTECGPEGEGWANNFAVSNDGLGEGGGLPPLGNMPCYPQTVAGSMVNAWMFAIGNEAGNFIEVTAVLTTSLNGAYPQ